MPSPDPLVASPSAYRAGYAEAVTRLRDDERYRNWWSADGAWQHAPTGRYWDASARGHLADYLDTVGPDQAPAASDQPMFVVVHHLPYGAFRDRVEGGHPFEALEAAQQCASVQQDLADNDDDRQGERYEVYELRKIE